MAGANVETVTVTPIARAATWVERAQREERGSSNSPKVIENMNPMPLPIRQYEELGSP